MSFDAGFNFRATLTYVTDPAGTVAVLWSGAGSTPDLYPTTRGGFTFGWDADNTQRDRNAGNDARLAGHHRQEAGAAAIKFRVDLPTAGTYEVRLAMGDASYAVGAGGNYFRILDDTTQKFSFGGTATAAANRFMDATYVERTSDSDWLASNVAQTIVFATTICIIEIGNAASTNISPLAHLRIVQVPDADALESLQHDAFQIGAYDQPQPTPGGTAFQVGQSNAFQGPAGITDLPDATTAFQPNAFQLDSFQVYPDLNTAVSTGTVAITVTTYPATVSLGTMEVLADNVAITVTTHRATVDDGIVVSDTTTTPAHPHEDKRRRVRYDDETLRAMLLEQIEREDREILKVIEVFLEQGTVYRMAA